MKIAAAVIAAVLVPTAVAAAKPAKTPKAVADVLACRAETTEEARLRCYDAAVAALDAAHGSGSLVTIDKEEVKKARRGLFGFSLPDIPFLGGDDDDEEPQARELTAKLKSARVVGYHRWLMDIEGAGTWQTIETHPNDDPPKAGAEVVIRKGPLGNYMMSVGKKRGIRVKRVG